MNKKLLIFSLIIVFAFAITMAHSVRAQEETPVSAPYTQEIAPEPALINEDPVPTLINENEVATPVLIDETASVDTPAAEPAGKSFPGAFSRWFKNVQERIDISFTFNEVRKAEKRLKYAERKINLAEAFSNKTDNPQAQKIATKLIEQADKYAAKIEERKAKFLENVDEKKMNLLENFAEHQVSRERALERVEDRASGKVLEKMKALREEIQDRNKKSPDMTEDNNNVPVRVRNSILEKQMEVQEIRNRREMIREENRMRGERESVDLEDESEDQEEQMGQDDESQIMNEEELENSRNRVEGMTPKDQGAVNLSGESNN